MCIRDRNVAMHYAEVDLAALLKQVQYELADKTEASGIDFRRQLPEERMPLVLDGQKMCIRDSCGTAPGCRPGW